MRVRGECRAATDLKDGSRVAIKKVKQIFHTKTLAKRTLRELRILRHLRHDNVRRETHRLSVTRHGMRPSLTLSLHAVVFVWPDHLREHDFATREHRTVSGAVSERKRKKKATNSATAAGI